MIETIFAALWIGIFCTLCVAIRRAIRQRVRETRHDHVRSLRRFTGEFDRPRRRRSRHAHAVVEQPVAA